ncbi:MAG: AraC family transcriptional regulator [Verrucomicrobia bacterium]|nr:AraC family transcriptional regulator [Verrucomicrobiota bacterium]
MPFEIGPRIYFKTAKGSPVGRITLAGLLRDHTGVPDKPTRTLGSFAVVYVLRGKGTFRTAAGFKHEVVPGDLLTVFPDIPHWYGPPKGSVWDEFYIVFSGKVFDLWRANRLLDPARPIRHLEPLDYWLRRLQEVVVSETDSLQQVCCFQHVLAEALEASDTPNDPHWLQHARNLLEAAGNTSPQAIARGLGMSYASFRNRFTTATGTAPGHYRTTKLIDRACSLIVAGGVSNKEVAERLGFCDEFHFSRRFKQVMGLSPSQFRHKLPLAPEKQRRRKTRNRPAR